MLKKLIVPIAAIATAFSAGCITQEIQIQPVHPWENHYYTVESFKSGTSDIQLEDGETIWVLSSRTLKRVLKDNSRR